MRRAFFALGVWGVLAWLSAQNVVLAADAGPAWLVLPNASMETSANSALDLSALVKRRNPASKAYVRLGADGESFERSDAPGQRLRFFTATLGLSPNDGGFPDHATADRLALMIKCNGYNAVRVHLVDAMLMTGRKRDFDFDPEQLDRFFYLLASLREQGMYFFVDMLSSWNGAYGDVAGHRWVRGQHDVTLGSLLAGSPEQQHWLALVKALWARKNPYSGLSILEDPAVAGVVLVNEGGMDFLLRKESRSELAIPFRTWLFAKYGSAEATRQVLGKAPDDLALPRVSERSALAREFQQFSSELQVRQLGWMRERLRELGFRGLVTSFNDWPGYHAAFARRGADFVDMHQYADHPLLGMVEPGTKMTFGRLLDGRNRFMDRLAWSRQFGQPYTVTEYGQPFWNPWRWEAAPFTAAYGRLQDWSLLAHYGSTFSLTRPALGKWRSMIAPFQIAMDPTLRAGETIAAFLFGRGDVTPSDRRLVVQLDSRIASEAPADSFVPWSLAQMQYVLGVGLAFDGKPATGGGQTGKQWVLNMAEDGINAAQVFKVLQEKGVVPSDTWTSPSSGRYQSTTGELRVDLKQHVMSVVTKGSVGLLGSAGSRLETPSVKLQIDEGEGAVFVADLSGGDLSKSRRALLIVSTDSRNSGMSFRDSAETELERIGTLPALLRDASVVVELQSPKGLSWRLFALRLNGERAQELSVSKLPNGRVRAEIRLMSLASKVTPYFEWVAE